MKEKALHDILKDSQDKSPKGFVDPPIIPFMDVINQTKSFCTTSSCSGRIAIFAEKNTDKQGFWLFVSHEKHSDINSLFKHKVVVEKNWNIAEFEGMQLISFKFEPFILHISSPDAIAGQELLNVVFEAGYRTSGLVNGKKRCMVVIKDTLKIDAPIGYFDSVTDTVHLIVDYSYLELLLLLSNQKFIANQIKMDKLLRHLTYYMQEH
jgi:tRNA wybutosine-synthesizing protein 3